ncbi:MAG: GGDEF domain-containing protein [Acidobacteriia bacterium]|nr:GGDEF domain-containing protein [Terriglobia bacterium]
MISINHAMSDLEKCDQLRLLTLDCYIAALQNAAQYAVELEDTITVPHRSHLKALTDGLAVGTAETLTESRSALRGLLREYRDKAADFLKQLREELSSTATALQDIYNAFNQSDGDHAGQMRKAVKTLREISESEHLEAMRPALVETTAGIEQSLEELRKQHLMTVSQFLVEIRGLHQRIDALENAAALDTLTKVFNRAEMEKRIRGAPEGAALLLVGARGIRQSEKDFGKEVAQELAGAFIKRLRNSLTPAAVLGRWGEEEFIAIGPPKKAEALTAAKWIAERLSGAYACVQGGRTVRPAIQVEVAVVERLPGADAEPALAQVQDYLKG